MSEEPRKPGRPKKPRKRHGDRGPDKEPVERDGRLYPRGVPVDHNGFYDPEGTVRADRIGEIPLDETAARLTKETHDAMKAHARGDRRIKAPGDDPSRYFVAAKEHPQASVVITQVFPTPNHGIPPQPVSVLRSWAEMNAFIIQNYWDGDKATFQYRIGDHKNASWHIGQIHYEADPNFVPERDMAKRNDQSQQPQQQPQQPQWQYNQYGQPVMVPPGMMPPGAPPGMMPPMMGGMVPGVMPFNPMVPPWMQQPFMQPPPMQQQNPQQPQAPAPAPPAPMQMPYPQYVDPAAAALVDQNKQMFTMFLDMMKTQAQQPGVQPQDFNAQWQWFQMQMWQQQQAMQMAAAAEAKKKADEAAAAEAAKAKVDEKLDEVEQTKKGIEKLSETIKQARKIADILDPGKADREAAAEAATKKDEDDFPLAVKEIGIGRYAYDKHTRQPVDATTALMMNADKISEGLEKVFDKFVTAWMTRGEMAPEDAKRHAEELRIKAIETEGKLAAIKRGQDLEEERLRVERLRLVAATPQPQPAPQPQPSQVIDMQPAPPSAPAPQPPATVAAAPPPPPPPPSEPPPATAESAVRRAPSAGGARAPRFPGAQTSP